MVAALLLGAVAALAGDRDWKADPPQTPRESWQQTKDAWQDAKDKMSDSWNEALDQPFESARAREAADARRQRIDKGEASFGDYVEEYGGRAFFVVLFVGFFGWGGVLALREWLAKWLAKSREAEHAGAEEPQPRKPDREAFEKSRAYRAGRWLRK